MKTVKTTYSCLPHLTPRARELQLSIEYWMKMYQEARVLSSVAWDEHTKAIDTSADPKAINALYGQGTMLEDIAIDAWQKWQDAKGEMLALLN
jgi:hypothetical protein